MNWFLIALINPLAHAIINHFDKFLLSKYIKGGTVGALILFSALFSIFALPVIWLFNNSVFVGINFGQALLLIVNGAMLTVAILCYLYALDIDEASFVAPFFQIIPVLGFLFGWAILGETITGVQIFGSILILLGGIILSFNLNGEKITLKKKVARLMLASSALYALNAVLFKSVAVDLGFSQALFWDMLGKVLLGVILFFAVKSYRQDFLRLLKISGSKIIGLNVINEIIGLIGEWALIYAAILAPVVLVQSVSGLQPAFVFAIGILLTLFLPKLGQESLRKVDLIQKFSAITIMTIGVIILAKSGLLD